MGNNQTLVTVHTSAWMTSVQNKDGLDALYFGDVQDDQNLKVVVLRPGGATRFFCKKHERIFHPTSDCPECAGVLVQGTTQE
jgi:hypothetical protein